MGGVSLIVLDIRSGSLFFYFWCEFVIIGLILSPRGYNKAGTFVSIIKINQISNLARSFLVTWHGFNIVIEERYILLQRYNLIRHEIKLIKH
jgi:hypothetical protein